uniref:TFIIS central domain-containing protein n=1 Tax=Chrysotila carterae TaxID=13221 RepID=A0A7S4EY66_CHRCT
MGPHVSADARIGGSLCTAQTISVQQELSSAPRETFRGKYRALLFNLKDAKNPDLRHRLLEGTLCARELLRLSPREMAAEALQQQRSEWRQKRTRERIRPDWRECGGFTTTLFRCERCGGTESKDRRARLRRRAPPREPQMRGGSCACIKTRGVAIARVLLARVRSVAVACELFLASAPIAARTAS